MGLKDVFGKTGKNMYSRTTSAGGGTVVPDMHKAAPAVAENMGSVPEPARPVVGFLYSVSRAGVGEYWPVYIGRNTIGRDASSDICLEEGTVSSQHALLAVKFMQNAQKLVAQIRDEGGKTGLHVNGEELDFGIFEVKNGDVIRVGSNYELLLILINPAEHGLKVSDDFIATGAAQPQPSMSQAFGADSESTHSPYDPSQRAKNATQSLDGMDDFSAGKTQFL